MKGDKQLILAPGEYSFASLIWDNEPVGSGELIEIEFAGTVEAGTVAEYGDDGVSQKAAIKTGIASKGEAIIPSPIKLKPYRTFLEVSQPESDFVFRMKESMGVFCALFEADGGAWKMDAMEYIKWYLEDRLPEEQLTVIA